MPNRFPWLFLGAFLLLKGDPGAQYTVKKTTQPIVIDGALTDNAWSGSDSILLKDCTTGGSPAQATTAKAVWDSLNLYLAVKTRDNDVWSTSTQRDGGLYKDEAIEFFLDPDHDGKNYFEFEFNCRNALMDIFLTAPWGTPGGGGDITWNSANIAWKAVVHGTVNNPADVDTGMTLEVKIPWSDLKKGAYSASRPKSGDSSSLNFYRIEGRDSLHKEYSCMSPVGGDLPTSFHTPEKFAHFKFSDSLAQAPISAVRERTRKASSNGDGISPGLSCRSAAGKSWIRYSVSAPARVSLNVVNLHGDCIRRLDAGMQEAGSHMLEWNNSNAQGTRVARGLYIIVLSTSGEIVDNVMLAVE